MFGEEQIVKKHARRVDLIGNIFIISFLLILARLWYLQLYKGEFFLRHSLENQLRKEIVKAPRGMIFSRDNQLLVNNIPRLDVVIVPQYFKQRQLVFAKLSDILSLPVDLIQKRYRKGLGQERFRAIVIKKNLTPAEVARIETESFDLPGVQVRTFISREYIDQEVGSHVLGYISEISRSQLPKYRKRDRINYKLGDFIGQDGIEQEFDSDLRGIDGHEFMEVDALGRMKRHLTDNELFKGITNVDSIPGHNIRLTIDRDLQLAAYKSLEGKEGSVVAVDVHTGEILAMVSRPAYNPTKFSEGLTLKYWRSLINNPLRPMRNRAIQEHYSPGSTFKIFTAITALEEGMIDDKTEVMCPPTFKLGRRVYHDWKRSGFGRTDVYKSIKRSVDVFYYKIGAKLDIDTLAHYAKMFGFSSKTGVMLPREISGLIPTKEWKIKKNGIPWQQGETISCVIGQSYILVTPLQLAMAYAAIANKGTLYKPIIVKDIFDIDGKIIKHFSPQVRTKINEVSEKTFNIIHKALYKVVNEPKGTAYWFRGRGIEMAGKTGTSQVIGMSSKKLFTKCEEHPYLERHHGVFAAFAPAYDPKIAVAVVVEHGCHGSTAAAPVARDVITAFMKKYYPEEYKRNVDRQKARDKRQWEAIQRAKKKRQKEQEQQSSDAAILKKDD